MNDSISVSKQGDRTVVVFVGLPRVLLPPVVLPNADWSKQDWTRWMRQQLGAPTPPPKQQEAFNCQICGRLTKEELCSQCSYDQL